MFLLWNFADRFLSFIDVIKVEAGDLVNVTGIVATDANFDDLETITESGNLSLTVTATYAA